MNNDDDDDDQEVEMNGMWSTGLRLNIVDWISHSAVKKQGDPQFRLMSWEKGVNLSSVLFLPVNTDSPHCF